MHKQRNEQKESLFPEIEEWGKKLNDDLSRAIHAEQASIKWDIPEWPESKEEVETNLTKEEAKTANNKRKPQKCDVTD